MNEDQTASMYQMYSQGQSLRQIAERFAVSASTVRNRIKNIGGYEEIAQNNLIINQSRMQSNLSNNATVRGSANATLARTILSNENIARLSAYTAPRPGLGNSPEAKSARARQHTTARQRASEIDNFVVAMTPLITKYFETHDIELSQENFLDAFNLLYEHFAHYQTSNMDKYWQRLEIALGTYVSKKTGKQLREGI